MVARGDLEEAAGVTLVSPSPALRIVCSVPAPPRPPDLALPHGRCLGGRGFDQLVPVLLAHQASAGHVVPVAWYKLGSALGAGKALEVEYVVRGGPHDELGGGDGLPAAGTSSRRPEQPYVVVFAEYHIGFGEAGGSDVGEHGPAARALEAGVVPIAVQCVE